METPEFSGAVLLVKSLERNGARFVFGIPGAKIDAVFNALLDSPIRLILCRHEQNAAFMAAAYGRITGEPGIVLATSGPGVCNLTTGLLTATTEGDPVIAIGGAVARNMLLKSSHQNTDSSKIMEAVTKRSVSIYNVENIQEAIANAFRISKAPRKGACFLNIPCDVLADTASDVISCASREAGYGTALEAEMERAAKIISEARSPVLFLGEDSSIEQNVEPLRALIRRHGLPVVSTFQGAGVVSRDLFSHFVGRVGLFKNQLGDRLLDRSDVVVTVGYNPVEYDPEVWNADRSRRIIHLDSVPCHIHNCYQPEVEVLGDIPSNIASLSERLSLHISPEAGELADSLHQELLANVHGGPPAQAGSRRIAPLHFIGALREYVSDDDLVMCDIGTVYMWMARYFLVYKPRHLFFSNGQQTLGVAMPWAIAAKLTCPEKRVFAISGDGGFLFSSMELETAVREKTPFVQFVWTDGSYNMVLEQEVLKYGRRSGVDLGPVDLVSYAAAFGAKGYRLESLDGFRDLLDEAIRSDVPVLIDVPVDYSHNQELFLTVQDAAGN
ncbi:MAG: acetolactate synthase AlsS [Verrucomicrobiae bacterium]